MIEDTDDGQYHVKYTVEKPCSVKIKIDFRDEKGEMVALRGSPYRASFNEETSGKANVTIGPSLQKATLGQLEQL